jgi:thiamine kinase-like enzyme
MEEKRLLSVIQNFKISGYVLGIRPYGAGHINDTYLVETAETDQPDYILQRINHNIFQNVPELMHNIAIVITHLRKKDDKNSGADPFRISLRLIESINEQYYYVDETGNYWRAFIFLKETRIYEKVTSPTIAEEAGKAIGHFQNQLADLKEPLYETLPRFHSINRRWDEFLAALQLNKKDRIAEASAEIAEVRRVKDRMISYNRSFKELKIPVRITHNDTKVNNILFNEQGKALCLIDLDTVMPGYVHYDYGDALRTLACSSAEDEEDISKVFFQINLFKAFTRGYIREAKRFLTKDEISLLAFAPLYLTFIIGLRFLTDHLNGDIYYKIHKPGHNFFRARTQLRLFNSMETHLSEIQKCVEQELT